MATFTHKLYLFGCKVSDRGANLAGHPAAIALVAVFCAVWFVRGGPNGVNTLTLILSVLAITLTQMVLNQQRRSEAALHMKIDELILAKKGARDELAGIEKKTEDELEQLRRDEPPRDCDAVLDDPPRPSEIVSSNGKPKVTRRKPARTLRNGAGSPMVARGKKGKVDADDGKANGSGDTRRKRGAGGVRAG